MISEVHHRGVRSIGKIIGYRIERVLMTVHALTVNSIYILEGGSESACLCWKGEKSCLKVINSEALS